MVTFTVSPTTLREKAHLIRTLLEESRANHKQLWSQISAQHQALPRDLGAVNINVNTPWHSATTQHYDNHHQLTLNMEAAADAYEKGDQDVKSYFDAF